MFRRSLHWSDLFWLSLIVGAIALHWLLPDFRADVATDSFRTGPRGKKAFFLLSDRMEYGVRRSFSPLTTLVRQNEVFAEEVAILLLGPARTPTTREWEALAAHVSAGGVLVFAAPDDAPVFDAGPFGVSGKELDEPIDIDGRKSTLQVDLGGLAGTFSWQSRGELLAPDARQIVVAEGSVQAVVQRHGAGTAVFIATDRPFSNYSLTWPDNAVLAFRLLESAGWRSEIIFDESLNASGTPKIVATLLDRPLRSFTVHLFALLAAFGWWRSRPFGPLAPPSVPPRSDIVAHADAVGMLHYKSRDGRVALRHYLRQLTSELKLKRLSGSREERILDPIARRLGRPVDDVKKVFRQASSALKQPKLERSAAAKQIRKLAKIRRAARDRTLAGSQDLE